MNKLILIALLCLNACSFESLEEQLKNNGPAHESVKTWIKLWDSNQGSASGQYISKAMTKALPIDKILEALESRRSKLGINVKRELTKVVTHQKLYDFPAGEYVAFHFNSDYSNQKSIEEVISVIKEDGAWLIVSDIIHE